MGESQSTRMEPFAVKETLTEHWEPNPQPPRCLNDVPMVSPGGPVKNSSNSGGGGPRRPPGSNTVLRLFITISCHMCRACIICK